MHRWAAMEIEMSGDAQEIVGALLMETAGCQGFVATPTSVTGYLPVDDRLENTLLSLRAALHASPDLSGKREINLRFVQEEDWANAWKQYFKPQRIGHRIVIKPTWEDFSPDPGDLIVRIDPGMAFGTGLHATTRLCLRALEETVTPGATVADIGTGSGILAIAAVLLGASTVSATDNDPLAVRVARENVAVNAVQDRIPVVESSLPPEGAFDIVVANILADVILGMATELFRAVKPDGVLIASGIIDNRADSVRKGLTAVGFGRVETQVDGEWVALIARR
ncbi:MAG: 50S ribosomal protein L11 methyltransferase [Capsulimonadales bacterium]|nr:50S ribosomal protein L11 methyltransferase [Capsulimonadales bacterium]